MNILIVGLGSIAKKHIKALEHLNLDATIYALRSDANASKVENVINVFDLEAVDVSFDFAIISNPTHLHFEFIERLALKHIPLFIEKPAVHTLDNSETLTQIIKDNNLITYVACNLRFHPCLSFLWDTLQREQLRINEVNVYCGSYLPEWRANKDYKSIYSANADMGGGVHLDLFHEIDYTTWLFGFPNKSSSVLRSTSSIDINAYDYANYILEYDTFTANIVLNYYRRKAKREIELVLDMETITVDLINNTVVSDLGKTLFEAKDYSIQRTYESQLKYFTDVLKQNIQPMNSFNESIKNLKICLQHD
ncbi:Gfo/Idh/MocA family protein [Psychroserpens sp. SPM9]|uniref:Gfo/Idh/MocA family protein n=1 Tax=Psychroserpens sp. SPM9 TaxID=2975598 RepID=UPI0021A8023E|nr:Gfo/Idh/MocA family oxidoreductase [Psychroserpens sp. SPM9]MDG5490142.1 Gfo/Idh/MocA family oxidoreductase [Psychroserpens sp. SPM9]